MNFEELSLKYNEKNIIKISKRLAKSFALTRSKDLTNLYELAFWLYIYDYKDEILNIYNIVNIDIHEKINFNIWTWILAIWGLQAYIYESEGNKHKKDEIVANMKKVYSVPRTKEDTESIFIDKSNKSYSFIQYYSLFIYIINKFMIWYLRIR